MLAESESPQGFALGHDLEFLSFHSKTQVVADLLY